MEKMESGNGSERLSGAMKKTGPRSGGHSVHRGAAIPAYTLAKPSQRFGRRPFHYAATPQVSAYTVPSILTSASIRQLGHK